MNDLVLRMWKMEELLLHYRVPRNPIAKLSENSSCAQLAFRATVHSEKSIQSSGKPPGLFVCSSVGW